MIIADIAIHLFFFELRKTAMNLLIYGCGEDLFRIRKAIQTLNLNIDYSDSDKSKWGNIENPYIEGDYFTVLPPSEVDIAKYDYAIIGSLKFEDEIRNTLSELGFPDRQILPASIIGCRRWTWKNGHFISEWQNTIENENIQLIDNWHWDMEGKKNICFVKLKNFTSPYNLSVDTINLFQNECTLTVNKLIRGGSKQEYSLSNGHSITILVENMVEILEISISGMGPFIPFLFFGMQNIEEHQDHIENGVLKNKLLFQSRMERFPYHDQDYLALQGDSYSGTILDIGANYGQSLAAFYFLTNSKIVSVEADPELCKVLYNVKIKLKDEAQRIKIINCGISDSKGEIQWYEPDNLSCCGSFDREFLEGFQTPSNPFKIQKRRLPCDTIDSLFRSFSDIWFVKMDVENFELRAIKGGVKFIQSNHPIMLMEKNQWQNDVCEVLKSCYTVKYYDPVYNQFSDTDEWSGLNYWLIPKQKYTTNDNCKMFKKTYSLLE